MSLLAQFHFFFAFRIFFPSSFEHRNANGTMTSKQNSAREKENVNQKKKGRRKKKIGKMKNICPLQW